jgi:hypothetical protein
LSRHSGATAEEGFKRQLAFLSIQALARQDIRAWADLQRARLNQEELKLAEERFKRERGESFSNWYEDSRVREIAQSKVSDAEKIETLRRLMYGEDWNPNEEETAARKHQEPSSKHQGNMTIRLKLYLSIPLGLGMKSSNTELHGQRRPL